MRGKIGILQEMQRDARRGLRGKGIRRLRNHGLRLQLLLLQYLCWWATLGQLGLQNLRWEMSKCFW